MEKLINFLKNWIDEEESNQNSLQSSEGGDNR